MIKISPSILNSKNRMDSINKLNNTNADYLHIDVMDGKFVNNTQFPITEILELEKASTKKLDIHLMVENPEKNIDELISKIKDLGYKVGISIKPNTNINSILPYLNKIDLVLIMSVEPGFGGQQFMPESLNKADSIKHINKNIIIEIDGGIKDSNINIVKEHVDIAVVGSYITNHNNYNEAINNLKN